MTEIVEWKKALVIVSIGLGWVVCAIGAFFAVLDTLALFAREEQQFLGNSVVAVGFVIVLFKTFRLKQISEGGTGHYPNEFGTLLVIYAIVSASILIIAPTY